MLDVPIQLDVGVLLREVEASVPRAWEEDDVPRDDDGPSTSMSFARGPFTASFDGEVASLSATIAYALRSSVALPLLPDINVSCGTDEDRPRPRMDVSLLAPLTVAPDWTLRSRVRVSRVSPTSTEERDRCEVTILDFDVTDRVSEGIRSFLTDHASAIDSIVAGVDLRPQMEQWWSVLAEPVRLDDNLWLDLRPNAIARGDIDGRGDVVEIVAQLSARPAIVFGGRPDVDPAALPPLGIAPEGGTFEAIVDVLADYDEVSRALTRQLQGQAFEGAGQRVRLERVSLSGIGRNQVAVALDIAGDVDGTLYLVGTPSYVASNALVRVPDLRLTVETSDLLVRGASWILGAGVERMLRERVEWPVEGGIAWARERLHEGLNAPLGDGLRLRGTVDALDVLNVLARAEGFLVRARAAAQVELLVGEP